MVESDYEYAVCKNCGNKIWRFPPIGSKAIGSAAWRHSISGYSLCPATTYAEPE